MHITVVAIMTHLAALFVGVTLGALLILKVNLPRPPVQPE
ncbi:MAG: hypothetical protein JWN93_423 [Hyphomicrobiales bacterium]|nr:hypothetical protein [Hyphomicrobiales bacterium]